MTRISTIYSQLCVQFKQITKDRETFILFINKKKNATANATIVRRAAQAAAEKNNNNKTLVWGKKIDKYK